MDRPPTLGDVVGLPAWLPDRPFRVAEVRDPDLSGHVWIKGWFVNELPRVEIPYLVPLARLRLLPDPTFGGEP